MSVIPAIRIMIGGGGKAVALPDLSYTFAEVAGHDALVTAGTPSWGSSQNFQAIFTARKQRIRQNGNIEKISFYLTDVPARLSSFKFYVLRKPGAQYTTVKIHEVELLPVLVIGLNEILLETHLAATEGDFIAISYESSGAGSNFLLPTTSAQGIISNTDTGAIPLNKSWGNSAATSSNHFGIKVYMKSPDLIGVGDSILAGFNQHAGYVYDYGYDTDYKYSSILFKLADRIGCTYQNNAVGNTTANEIEAWFDADVVAMNPIAALIMVGVNDAATAVSVATYSAKIISMIGKCNTAGIIPIIGQILPWTNGNNTQHTRREEMNAWIVDYCTTNNILTFNASERIGIDRVGFPAGNLRDLQAGMSDDGVHLTELGKDGVVDELEDLLRTNLPLIVRR